MWSWNNLKLMSNNQMALKIKNMNYLALSQSRYTDILYWYNEHAAVTANSDFLNRNSQNMSVTDIKWSFRTHLQSFSVPDIQKWL